MFQKALALLAAWSAAPFSHAQIYSADELSGRTLVQRAMEAAIWGIPLVNVDSIRQAFRRAGAKYNDAIFWSNPDTWINQTTTPTPSTTTSSSS